jgi:hypothetical protein
MLGNFYDNFPRYLEKNAWFSENFTIIFVAGFVTTQFSTHLFLILQ